MTKHISATALLVSAALVMEPSARAQQDGRGVEFSGSGFLTVAAGTILKGDAATDFNGYRAPLYVADYAQGGVYEDDGWSLKPDTRLGLQGSARFSDRFSVTGQVVARGARDGKVDLEWIYANYHLSDKLTLQAGRKRLPIAYYSETQDVGFTYPWVHLPPANYGWEIVNYNGVNLLYREQWGAWSSGINVFAGAETKKDGGFWKIYNGKNTRTDVKWGNIFGADLSLTRDWFELRLGHIRSDFRNRYEDPALTPPYAYTPKARQKLYSLSLAIDHGHWVLRNEYLYIDRKPVGEEDYAQLYALGYRIGKYLPMLTYSNYKMRLTPGFADPAIVDPASIDPLSAEAWAVWGVSLRYDLTASSALKIQYERWKDKGGPNFNGGVPYGNARLLSLSYDLVF